MHNVQFNDRQMSWVDFFLKIGISIQKGESEAKFFTEK